MIKKKALANWEKHEISHLKKKLKKIKRDPNEEWSNYWMITLIAMVSGAVSAAALATANIIIPSTFLALIAGILGWGLGNNFTAALLELEDLTKHHHIIYGSLILISSVVSFVFIMNQNFFRQLSAVFGIQQNPLLIGIAYALFFLLPYFLRHVEVHYERLGHPLR